MDFWQATFIDNNLRLAVTRDDRDKIKPLNLSINKVLESIRLSHLRKSGTLFLSAIPSESSSPSTSSSDPFGSSPSSFISSHFDTKSVSPVMPSRYTLYSDYTLINLSKILKTSYDTVFQFQGVDQFMVKKKNSS